MKKFNLVLAVVLIGFVAIVAAPRTASADWNDTNLKIFDELNTVYEIGGHDALFGSEALDVGLMVGATNLGNPWNDQNPGSYVMVKADVKGIRLLNRIFGFLTDK